MMNTLPLIGACTAATAATLAVATLPQLAGGPMPWFVLLAGYGVLATWCAFVLRKRGEWAELVRPRSGDLTLGIVTGLVLAGAAFLALRLLAPMNEPRAVWMFAVYAQLGDVQGELWRTAALLLVVISEEVVWRGLVLRQASTTWGPMKGLVATVASYAAAHVATAFTLQAPGPGLNPLLVLGALGCGAAWATLTLLTQRLVPTIVCHAVLSYFAAAPAPSWLW